MFWRRCCGLCRCARSKFNLSAVIIVVSQAEDEKALVADHSCCMLVVVLMEGDRIACCWPYYASTVLYGEYFDSCVLRHKFYLLTKNEADSCCTRHYLCHVQVLCVDHKKPIIYCLWISYYFWHVHVSCITLVTKINRIENIKCCWDESVRWW